ncbi:zinc knuckle CX2CX4HX4C containing protein [Tanacetum coccineum]|uniref:Zinc knuckle CX2CX4HX4C containing protein n=1 Tax=Tanacetum coccineum TaxID=301880 RepID=A0ABQ5DLZ7_9ASTR
MEQIYAKYESNWKYNDGLLNEIREDLRRKAYNEPDVVKDYDEDLSSGVEIMVMGDISFSYTNDDDDLESDNDTPNALVEEVVKKTIKKQAKPLITYDKTNENTTLSEAQGCDPANHLWRESDENRLEQGYPYLSVIVGASRDLKGLQSFIEGYNAKGVGLRVVDSHTGNHREDDFTPLETIRSAKNILHTQTCTLTKDELTKFLTDYGILSEYKVMLPKSNQTIYDAPDGFVGLYTHSFSLANLRLPLPKFFYDVLEYFRVHLSRLNHFGYAKLTTFAVMCKAYGGEPSVDLFRGFFNLYPSWEWLAFAKRPEEDSFLDPILFLLGLKMSWEHSPKRPAIFVRGQALSWFQLWFPVCSINNEPPLLEVELLDSANLEQLVENTADSRGSLVCEEMPVIGSSSVVERMKSRKCRMKGSTKPLVKPLRVETVVDCHLMISNVTPSAWRGHLDNQLDVELLDLHDRCYMKGECEVLKERERARDRECEELRLADFDSNHVVNVLRQKIKSLLDESQRLAEKGKLEAVEALFCQEIEALKCNRAEVVSKVVPYVAMELVHSNEMVVIVEKLMSFAIFYKSCAALEEVANMKEPFDLAKVKGYRPTYKKEHTKAGNDLDTATFPFLSEVVADPSASVEALLSKKSKSIRRPTPTKTHALAPSAPSQKATSSSAPHQNLSNEGPSIHKDWSRGTKVFDGESIGLKGGIEVVEVVVKWNDGGRGGICEGIEGEEPLHRVTYRIKSLKGGLSSGSQPRLATRVKANHNSWIPNSTVIQEDILGSEWTHDGLSKTNVTVSQDVGENVLNMGGDTHGKGSCFPITNPISDLKDTKVKLGLSTPGNNIISELFGISLKTYKDFEEFINNIELAFKAKNLDDNITNKVSPSDPIVQSVDINTKSTSYAGVAGAVTKEQLKVTSNFRPLVADHVFNGVNISIPLKVIQKVSTRLEHTLYGYFIGKRLAFLVVEYYARNNWAGLEAVLEGSPWMILNSSIILKKWSMGTSLLKEELTGIPIWVKLHDVPLQVFEEDGISLIATFIGKPIMLDSYTSFMCNDSWGRSSFARCLIEVNSKADLVDVVTIVIHSLNGDDFTKETICVGPPIVTTSNVVTPTVEKTNDGFQTVGKKKKRKGKSTSTNGCQFAGLSVKQNVRYEPKATPSAPKKGPTIVGNTSKSSSSLKTTGTSSKNDNIFTSNSYSALNDEEEEVEDVYDESANLYIKPVEVLLSRLLVVSFFSLVNCSSCN